MTASRPLGILALCVSLSIAGTAHAQNVHIAQLYDQVLENADIMGGEYSLESFGIQRMSAGTSQRIPLDLPTGRTVTIMGDCDEDCRDMNLTVYSQAGKPMGEDVLDDNYPVVSFATGADGRISVGMDMVRCDASYCYAAYSVFVTVE